MNPFKSNDERQAPLDAESPEGVTPEPEATSAEKSPGLGVTGKFPSAVMEEQRDYAPDQIGEQA